MNFTSMPELSWEYGCGAVISLALPIVVPEIIYFKRKDLARPKKFDKQGPTP